MFRKIFPAILMTGMIVCGCLHTQGGQAADGTVAVETVHASAIGGGGLPSPKVVWIDDGQQLSGYWKSLHSQILGASTPTKPDIDWKTHGLLLIYMGQKTSGGYGLELTRPQARVKGANVYVDIHWIEPPPGTIVTQVITSPCLLVKIERGSYRSVVILDQTSSQRTMTKLIE